MKKILSFFMVCLVALTISAQPTSNPLPQATRTTPYVLYGYLKVFPNDLGTFESEPTTIITQINKTSQHGYNTWRIPTKEELSLLVANNIISSSSDYISSNGGSSGKVRLVTDKETTEVEAAREKAELQRKINNARAQGYVYLGLPSGTLWKDKNEDGDFYTYDQAMAKFGSKLPTQKQFSELQNFCRWNWTGNGFKIVGPSGESIFLPAAGYRNCTGNVYDVGFNGYYWTSSPYGSDFAWKLDFNSSNVTIEYNWRCIGRSVHLIQ